MDVYNWSSIPEERLNPLVTRQVISFVRRQLETGQPLGEVPLELPARTLRTRAVWWTISAGQRAELARLGVDLAGAAHAAEHASIGLFSASIRMHAGALMFST